ncbi:MAG: DUF5018 domain-containing protein [Prevotella sp.]|nr:DUF5018 domain-containing protein [Prevotella sp.]MDD7190437.1 DUF5018 domain-containing protein [Prevotella sp.]MDY3875963.1 DUF5018 domain-containing protein [Prevotella sp.]
MKTKIFNTGLMLALALAFTGCAEEENVAPTANREGITSLSAYFTSGTYQDKLAAQLSTTSSETTDYVIPIPYYYPEESDYVPSEDMKNMKVTAKLENNCFLSPGLGVLDLTKKNEFTYTNPYGEQKKITISGQLTHLNKCAIKSFMAEPGDLTGVIDEESKTISLVTAADLSEMTADVVLDPHATISPDPSVPHNFNDGFEFTVTADNGVDKSTYKVMKQIPPKIDNGYRAGSEKELFVNDMTTLGVKDPNAIHPTLACIGNFVVLNLGDGSAPQYFRKATGSKVGTIALGEAKATGAIASDNVGNMLICNFADNGQTLNIYKTNDVTKAPTKLISYTNGLGVGIGARLHVQGDLNSNAVITATPYSCNNAIRWIVKDGRVGNPENILMSVAAWGAQDDAAKVVGVDAEGKNGSIVDYYQSGACQMYYLSDWKTSANLVQDNSGNAWGYNTAAIDVRPFNKARYLTLFEMGYWPDWGLTGHIYLYDASNPASVTGTTDGSSMLKYAYTIPDNFGSVGYASDGRFADVLVTPSEDGYFLYIFYASNTHLSFGGIQVDCIKK